MDRNTPNVLLYYPNQPTPHTFMKVETNLVFTPRSDADNLCIYSSSDTEKGILGRPVTIWATDIDPTFHQVKLK